MNDWIFLSIPNTGDTEGLRSQATLAVRLGMTYLTSMALFVLVFMKAFQSRVHRRDAAFTLPSAAMLWVCWNGLVRGVRVAPWGWRSDFDPVYFGAFVVYALFYVGLGLLHLYKVTKVLSGENPRVWTKARGLFFMFLIMVVMGASTNVLFDSIGIGIPPLFSSLLLVPGSAVLWLLSPLTKDRVAVFIRRWKARAYEMRHAFLVYQNGTLIASNSAGGDSTMVDKDIFAATLDAIQTFMRTSFPLLRGKWLKTIEHGEFKIILERGQKVYLAVVISGEENDDLRRKMRDAVTAVEIQNLATLMDWSGVPDDVKGAKAALGSLFRREDVF